MAEFILHRVDNRLIHGHVAAISVQLNAKNILIVDDILAEDSFMKQVYTSATPRGTKIEMLSTIDTITRWNKDRFGKKAYLALYRDIETPVRLWESGFPIQRLQIGNVALIPGAKIVHRASRLSSAHLEKANDMIKSGVEIYW